MGSGCRSTSHGAVLAPPPGGEACSSSEGDTGGGAHWSCVLMPILDLDWGMDCISLLLSSDTPLSFFFLIGKKVFALYIAWDLSWLIWPGKDIYHWLWWSSWKKKKGTSPPLSFSLWNYFWERFVKVTCKDFIICKDHRGWILGRSIHNTGITSWHQGLTDMHVKLEKKLKPSILYSAEFDVLATRHFCLAHWESMEGKNKAILSPLYRHTK